MKRKLFLAIVTCLLANAGWAAQRYPVRGVILEINRPQRTFIASCSAIPGYMEAMAMPFPVRDHKVLDDLQPTMQVNFTLVVDGSDSYAENIHVQSYQSLEPEPLLVRRLEFLSNFNESNSGSSVLSIGEPVSDFGLTDQTGQRIALSQMAGKVVAVTFVYTSCPLPNYCFRLSNNFGRLQKRFADRMGRDLVLLSITINPAHDQPEVLAKYAKTWNADPNSWHFLTGSLSDVKNVCHRFGVNYWPDEGSLTHSLHTAIIDHEGKLAANFEGNELTAEQLGDYIETTLQRRNQLSSGILRSRSGISVLTSRK